MKRLALLMVGALLLAGCGGEWHGLGTKSDEQEQTPEKPFVLDPTGVAKAFDLTQHKVSQDNVNALIQVSATVTNVGATAEIGVSVVGLDANQVEVTNTALIDTIQQSATKSVMKQYLVPLNDYERVSKWQIKKVTVL